MTEHDVHPETLQEWDKLSKDLEGSLKALTTESKDFNYQIPAGYTQDPDNPSHGIPDPKAISAMLTVLDRTRFKETMTYTEAVGYFRAKGLPIKTVQTVHATLDRVEQALGILPELPPSVHAKANGNKQRLEWRRKRRIAARDKDKKKKLIEQRKLLDRQLAKETKRRAKDVKDAKMTYAEVNGLDERVEKLKKDSKASRFKPKEKPTDSVVLFEPTPKQAEFLAAPEKVVFYGGAAGIC